MSPLAGLPFNDQNEHSIGNWRGLVLPGGNGRCQPEGACEPPHQYRYEWRYATHDSTHHTVPLLVGICLRCGKHRRGPRDPDWKNPWDVTACVHCWEWIFPPTHWPMRDWKPGTYYTPTMLDFTDPIAACRERGMPESIIRQNEELMIFGSGQISICEGGTPLHCPHHADLENWRWEMFGRQNFVGGFIHRHCADICPQQLVRPMMI